MKSGSKIIFQTDSKRADNRIIFNRPIEISEPWLDCLLEEYFMQVFKAVNSKLLIVFFH